MTLIETLNGMLAAIAPHIPDLQAIVEREPGTWEMECGDGRFVTLEVAATQNELVITAPLAPIPDEHMAEASRLLLAYGMVWTDTGGVRVGAADGTAVLMAGVALTEVSEKHLADVLASLLEKAAGWDEALRTLQGGGDEIDFSSMIRV